MNNVSDLPCHEDSAHIGRHGWCRRPRRDKVYKGAALPPHSLHLACISDSKRNKEVCMEARIFLGLAIGLLAVSSVVAFRDNGVQHKWSPYKPRLKYAE